MKNTTILIILLLVVSSTLYIKQREGMEILPIIDETTEEELTGDSLIKTNQINNINKKIKDMTVDYKVFNDETTNMANQQKSIFYVLAFITAIVVMFTLYYFLK